MATPRIDCALSKAANSLGYSLKPEQRMSVQKFVNGNDVFVSLPTGYGKSLCYVALATAVKGKSDQIIHSWSKVQNDINVT